MQVRARSGQIRSAASWPAAGRCAPGRRGRSRVGFTLLELLLVIGILMICAGAVAPSVMGVLANYHLKDGTQQVQAALAGTRVHAIDATSTYQFRFEPGGRRYVAVPIDIEVLSSPGTALSSDGAALAPGMFVAGTLPETLSFQVSTSSAPPPDSPPLPASGDPGWQTGMAKLPTAQEYASATWSDPIYFHVDGTASDATFAIVDTRGSGYRITVREVTGEIFVKTLETEAR